MKILFLDCNLHHNNPTGITLSNLFGSWPKENLFMISYPNQSEFSRREGYVNIFTLGPSEIRHRFPVNLFRLLLNQRFNKQEKEIPTPIKDNSIQETGSFSKKQKGTSLLFIIGNIINGIFRLAGLDHLLFRIVISPNLRKWIQNAEPDYFYSVLSTRHSILFALNLIKEFDKPLIIHIMDDWPTVIGNNTICPAFWNRIINEELKNLAGLSRKRLAISEKMAKEYEERFGGEWKYFHNPVDLGFWGKETKKDYSSNNPFVILYSGRLSQGINDTMKIIAECVEELNSERGPEIVLRIQSNSFPEWKEKYRHTEFVSYQEYQQLPRLFSSADLLLLPYDFKGVGFKFIRLSIPTKASEYMISGTPVLVVSPAFTALSEYAKKYGWGYLVTSPSKVSIKNGIKELLIDQGLREQIGGRAIECARNRHDIIDIQKEFNSIF